MHPLESAAVEARGEGAIAVTLLRQRFHNRFDESLEVHEARPEPAASAWRSPRA